MHRLSALLTLALVLAACDAADTTAAEASAADYDDAAVVLASAVALDAGGVLEDAASAASIAVPAAANARHPGPARRGCDTDRAYDEGAGLWTVTIDCERQSRNGRFSALFDRTSTYRFLDANGDAQRERRGAATVEYDVLSGTSLVQSPRGVHALTALASDLTVAALDDELVSVNGTYARAATDTLRSRRGERTLAYELDLMLDEVEGPRSTARRWRDAVSGTISGRLRATITRTPTEGDTETVEIDEDVQITFPTDGSGGRVAAIVLGPRRYRADVETGDVAGI